MLKVVVRTLFPEIVCGLTQILDVFSLSLGHSPADGGSSSSKFLWSLPFSCIHPFNTLKNISDTESSRFCRLFHY